MTDDFLLDQIIPKSQLKITAGGEPGCYTYKGDSGNSVNCYYCPKCTTHIYHHQVRAPLRHLRPQKPAVVQFLTTKLLNV